MCFGVVSEEGVCATLGSASSVAVSSADSISGWIAASARVSERGPNNSRLSRAMEAFLRSQQVDQ